MSLYNESAGEDIDPTPVVAVLGVIDELERRPPTPGFAEGHAVILLGEPSEELGGSRWAAELRSHPGGRLAGIDFGAHRRLIDLVARLVRAEGLVSAVHDVSSGGLGVALAECVAASGVGCDIHGDREGGPDGDHDGIGSHAALFSEAPGRVVVSSPRPEDVLSQARTSGVAARVIGLGGGDRFRVAGLVDLLVGQVIETWRGVIPAAVGDAVSDPV